MNEIARKVFDLIEPSYLVGGSLRDALLGRKISDYDFATPRTPDEVETAVRGDGRRAYVTGKRFGTIGFKVDGHFVEMTSFRGEIYKRGSRKPDVIFNTTLEDDLARRDFTINAMAQGRDGLLIDRFGGQEDLDRRIIRAVGNPIERFNDDPLRMLRAARFASQLDFDIEKETLRAMKTCAAELTAVAIQRCAKELDLLLTGVDPAKGIRALWGTGILEIYLPEVVAREQYVPPNLLGKLNGSENSIESRWATMLGSVEDSFTDSDDPAVRGYIRAGLISKIGTYLRWPKARIKAVQELSS